MKLFLNNLFKGLVISLVVICLGGVIYLKLDVSQVPTESVLKLVSTSLINSINTNNNNNNIGDGEIVDIEDKEQKIEEIQDETKEEIEIKESNEENIENQEIEEEQVFEEIEEIIVKGEYNPNLEVISTFPVLETYYGKMTGYGPDCYGCSGITASGMNVMDGNIYYNDQTFGSIRIVAGDKSIPFGSIIKITGINISKDPVLAIVLDRGGMIGFQEGKHSYFDLLYKSEADALSFGRQDATFELLRLGY